MRVGATTSALLHVGVFALAWWGVPHIKSDLKIEERPVFVELLPIAEKTNAPPPAPPAPEPPKPEPPKPEPPKPEPPKRTEAPPPPKPRPEPPKKQEAFDPNRIAALLDKTPKKPQQPQPQNQSQQKPEAKPASPAASTGSTAARTDQPLTMSEIDAIRTQIQRCWNVPAGARDARDLKIQIRFVLNRDGSLRGDPEIVDRQRASSDPFYRTAAESARRAVLQCSPLKNLPPDKYDRWRDIELTFDPKEMLG